MGHPVNGPAAGQHRHGLAVALFEAQILGLEALVGQVLGHASHIFGDGHAVVVEDDQQRLPAQSRVGEALISQTAGERAVADEGGDMVVLPQQGPGPGHAQGHRHRVGGVAGDEGVVDALLGLGEAGEAAEGAQRAHGPSPPSEDLVDVALVAHVEDQPVPAGVEDPVEGHGELHHAQVGGQVAAGPGHHIHHTGAQAGAQGLRLPIGDRFQIRDLVKLYQSKPSLPADRPAFKSGNRRPAGPRRCPGPRRR